MSLIASFSSPRIASNAARVESSGGGSRRGGFCVVGTGTANSVGPASLLAISFASFPAPSARGIGPDGAAEANGGGETGFIAVGLSAPGGVCVGAGFTSAVLSSASFARSAKTVKALAVSDRPAVFSCCARVRMRTAKSVIGRNLSGDAANIPSSSSTLTHVAAALS